MTVSRKGFVGGAVLGAGVAGAALAGIGLSWPSASADQAVTPPAASSQRYAPPAGAPMSFASIIERVSPAVVSIRATGRARPEQLGQFGGLPFGLGPNGPSTVDPEDLPDSQSAGSGFIIRPDGYIVTNNHVIENAEEITVVLSDQREFRARVVGRDEGTDLAVLKIEAGSVPYATFATESPPRVGDWVVAVGNPFDLGGTVTAGIVSAFGRDLPTQRGRSASFTDYIQIDAPINRGNSGGPTFDLSGRVIGVNTAIFSDLPTGGSVGIGFAVPASTADRVTRQLISGRPITRGYLGASVQTLTREAAEGYGLGANRRGAVIGDVSPGAPAQRAGLQAGDVILGFNGQPVRDNSDLTRRVAGTNAGDLMRLEVWRAGGTRTVEVRAGVRPSEEELNRDQPQPAQPEEEGGAGKPPAAGAEPQGVSAGGLTVAPLTPALRARYNLDASATGLVITNAARGIRGDAAGIQPGLLIVQVNGRPATQPEEFTRAVEEARRAGRSTVALLVRDQSGQNAAIGLRVDGPAAAATPAPTRER